MAQKTTPQPAEPGAPAAGSLRFPERGANRGRDLNAIVAGLRQSRDVTHNIRHGGLARRLPSRAALAEIVNGLTTALFPTHYGQPELGTDSIDAFVRGKLKTSLAELEEQIMLSLSITSEPPAVAAASRVAHDIAVEFASQLPAIRAALVADLRAAHENDPGAASMPEILLGHPGMVAIICYRMARALYLLGAPLIARLVTLVAHSRTGIDIHPGAEIGEKFSIDHGTGIVVGERTIIGKNVRLCQNVTLGANRQHGGEDPFTFRGAARHPVIEDNVFIFAGATILGRITIGQGSVIGGNVWLTRSVPPHSHITQTQLTGLATIAGDAQA